MKTGRDLVLLMLLTVLVSVVGYGPSYGYQGDPLAPFYGHYVGKTTDGAVDVTAMRNAEVIISPVKNGFNLQWATVIHRENKTVTRRFSIDFHHRGSSNVYGSAMKINTFGHQVPLDPLDGEPFLWAVVDGAVLVVHSLLIFKDGSYEMQSYERRSTKMGLDLRFTRIRNGTVMKAVQGKLLRK